MGKQLVKNMRADEEHYIDEEAGLSLVEGYEAIKSLWDWLLGSYNPPRYTMIENYDQYCEKLAEHAITVCITTDGNPVGAISLYANDTSDFVGFVTQLAVRCDCRRNGLGTRLIEAGESIARSYGMRELRLLVAEDNSSARLFYASLGYGVVVPSNKSGQLLLGKCL